MPPARHPFLEWPHPLAFAHRGGTEAAPENTMAAFAHAVGLGYRYLETDVHTTRDGVLVAFHDPALDRVTDRTGNIGDLPWSEVRRARVGASAEGVPLLEDLLGTWPTVRINIDAKSEASVRPLAETIIRLQARDRVCVASFSDRRVAAVGRIVGPGLCTALGTWGVARLRLSSVAPVDRLVAAARGRLPRLLRGPMGRTSRHCAQVPLVSKGIPIVDPAFLAAAHTRGLAVHVWTIDERSEIERLLALGVDGIMTDRPEVLKEILVGRGQWET